jgi:hypothetical protein
LASGYRTPNKGIVPAYWEEAKPVLEISHISSVALSIDTKRPFWKSCSYLIRAIFIISLYKGKLEAAKWIFKMFHYKNRPVYSFSVRKKTFPLIFFLVERLYF